MSDRAGRNPGADPNGRNGDRAPHARDASFMTANHVAARLQIPRRSVYALVDQGLLPYHRVGKRLLRFTTEDIETLFARSEDSAR